MGGAASSRRDPPHVTENDKGAPVQDAHGTAGRIAALPANASGRDVQPADGTGQDIREESAYENRPAEDAERPPSTGTGA